MSLLSSLRSLFASTPAQAPTAAFDSAPPALPASHQRRESSVQCLGPHGLHRMVYHEWGDPHNPRVLLCVHGLTRNGRDFDDLARALALEYRVVCPDVVGRGRSDWLKVKTDYALPLYLADLVTLIARLRVDTVEWLGTSMGGILGMLLASQPDTPITRLVLNDLGPVITAASLQRIGQYVGTAPDFPSLEAAEAYLREVSAPFGPLTDAQWRHLAVHAVRPVGDAAGSFRMAYDPDIGEVFRTTPLVADVDLWAAYDAVRCPTLALRGAESDLLEPHVHAAMAERGPRARIVEFAGVGHAPMLMAADQIAVVRDFLLAN